MVFHTSEKFIVRVFNSLDIPKSFKNRFFKTLYEVTVCTNKDVIVKVEY